MCVCVCSEVPCFSMIAIGLNVFTQNSSVENLTLKAMALGGGAFVG